MNIHMNTMRMMSVLLLLLFFTVCSKGFAQSPQAFKYQTIIRNASFQPVPNQTVGLKISLLQGSASGISVYEETHYPTTNELGLVHLEIGNGTTVSGIFSTIDWGNDVFFVKTELDPAGGTAWQFMGTSQLLSVPYALHAKTSDTPGLPGPVGPQGPPGLQGQAGTSSCGTINSGDGRIVMYNATHAWGYGFNETSGSFFYNLTLSGTLLGALASDSNIVIYTTTHAYGFGYNGTSGSGWYQRVMSAPPEGYVITSGRIVLYNASEAYGFGKNNTSGSGWYLRALSGLPVGSFAAGNRIVLYNNTDAYGFGFNFTSGSDWKTHSLLSPPDSITGTR
jgi:hypothetical protein